MNVKEDMSLRSIIYAGEKTIEGRISRGGERKYENEARLRITIAVYGCREDCAGFP